MTDVQKKQISNLRTHGFGYKSIASMVNLTRDAVKSYCKNHGLVGAGEVLELNINELKKKDDICEYCYGTLKTRRVGRPVRFCSDECRRAYWREHRMEGKRSASATYVLQCKYCGNTFESYGNKNRKYCTHEHYILDRFGNFERRK